MKIALVLLIIGVVVISGCVESLPIGVTTLAKVIDTPEDYLNKTIKIVGWLEKVEHDYLTIPYDLPFDYIIHEENEQGYKYEFYLKSFKEPHREIVEMSTYKISGKIKYYDVCMCEKRIRNLTGDCYGWYEHSYWKVSNEFTSSKSIGDITPEWQKIGKRMSIWASSGIGQDIAKQLVSECESYKTEQIQCNYKFHTHLGYIDDTIVELYGDSVIEYRCNPNSIERVFYIEGIEPMTKIS